MGQPIVVSVTSTKGGVGKTTTAANIGALFADFGMRTLLIDADPQNSLSKYYALEHRTPHGLTSVIQRGGVVTEDCVSRTTRPNLDIIVSDAQESLLQNWLRDREDRLVIMKRAVRSPWMCVTYDVVVIDTQGAVGELQKTAAMAADIMISPINPSILSAREFATGTMAMLESLNRLADFSAEFRSGELYALIYGMDRSNDSKMIADAIRSDFRGMKGVRVLNTTVPWSAAYRTAATAQAPVYEVDRPRKNRSQSGYEVLHQILWELPFNLQDLYYDEVSADPESEVQS